MPWQRVAIPSFIQGISTFGEVVFYIKGYKYVAIPSFIQGISTDFLQGVSNPRKLVAIPSFIQGISTSIITGEGREINIWGRNPFLYSGHFNNDYLINDKIIFSPRRNPFLYSGHFNYLKGYKEIHRHCKSQSLPLFRAFQQIKTEASKMERNGSCRNPFLYSGHFNFHLWWWIMVRSRGRNPFLYSGHFNCNLVGAFNPHRRGVAIPSFIQGISTNTNIIWKSYLFRMSQSLPLFRAFQPYDSKSLIDKDQKLRIVII